MNAKTRSKCLLSAVFISLLIADGTAFISPATIRRSSSLGSTKTNDSEIKLNPVVASVKVSKTVEIFSLVKQMEADGEKVTSLCVGEPDFLPPKVVLDAASAAVQRGDTKYTAVTGTVDLRNAIADDLQRRKGLVYDPQTEIVVGNGAKQSVYQCVLATCGPGDAAIVPAPYWPSYPEMVSLVGAEPIIVETTRESGYLMTPETLRSTLEANPAVKLIFLCSPGNPTYDTICLHDDAISSRW